MHLPNEFLNSTAATGMAGAALGALSFAIMRVKSAFTERIPVLRARLATFPSLGGSSISFEDRISQYGKEKMWRMAAAGSLIFAAQMVNFPVAHGTSGHLLGVMLAVAIVGPLEAMIVMSVVLATQAFFFGDGGIIVLGANIVNMGVVGVLCGYAVMRFVMRLVSDQKNALLGGVFLGAWVSVVSAAALAAVEIALSGKESLNVVLPALLRVHFLIGFGEAVITLLTVFYLLRRGFILAALNDGQERE